MMFFAENVAYNVFSAMMLQYTVFKKFGHLKWSNGNVVGGHGLITAIS